MNNNRLFLATLVSSAVAFFGGWLIFGFLFMDYYSSNVNQAAKILERSEPMIWAIAIVNIAWSLLISWVLQRTNNTGFSRGFLTSLWISFLICVLFDFSIYNMWDIYEVNFILMDIVISSIFWAFVGGISGAILGISRKTAPTPTPTHTPQ